MVLCCTDGGVSVNPQVLLLIIFKQNYILTLTKMDKIENVHIYKVPRTDPPTRHVTRML